MKRVEFCSWVTGSRIVECPGYVAAPGLIVHRNQRKQGKAWTVSHESSGFSLGPTFKTRAKAQEYAEGVAPLADWTEPEAKIVTAALARKCVDVLSAMGGSQ